MAQIKEKVTKKCQVKLQDQKYPIDKKIKMLEFTNVNSIRCQLNKYQKIKFEKPLERLFFTFYFFWFLRKILKELYLLRKEI
jgi:hypothetical protein